MGITSPLQPNENTVNGRRVGQRDTVAARFMPTMRRSRINNGVDVELFALFMRSPFGAGPRVSHLAVPPRPAATCSTTSAAI